MSDDIREAVRQWVAKADDDWASDHAVESRYPGAWYEVEVADVDEAVELAGEFGIALRPKLEG